MAEETEVITEETTEEMPARPEGGMPPMPPMGGGRGPKGPRPGAMPAEGELPEGVTKATKTITDEDGNEVEVEILVDADGNEIEMPEMPAMPEGGMEPPMGRGGFGGPGRGGRGPQGMPPMGGRGPKPDFAPEAEVEVEGEEAAAAEEEIQA